MNVLFLSNQLCLRGTSVAIYDYAHYNETILGNTSYIAAPFNSDMTAYDKFFNRFKTNLYRYDTNVLQAISDNLNIDVAYHIISGETLPTALQNCKNVYHGVFTGEHPGITAVVSKWLGNKYNKPHVSHIVSLPEIKDDYREWLNIPPEATVFGRYGGADSFDDDMVQRVVYNVALRHPGIYFLFMNTNEFCYKLPNIIHVEGSTDVEVKRSFVNTCSAMIYGRSRGETFGLSIAEFLYCNKPVICSINAPERNHIEIMGDKGIYFDGEKELEAILLNFKRGDYDYSQLVECFQPPIVMRQFEEIFLK